ncbi:hypothetical protein LIER_17277 [Lithospermum erythrorhizon]|uniref:X8 domain-containing protein n=1 Tax=Lithospermum erythrorhizon TaxID=34254 RepID=A0AAV3QB46_LITER
MLEMVSYLVAKDTTLKQHPKVSIPHSTEVLKPVTKPSEGEFKDEIKVATRRTLSILQKYEAAFVLNIMPFNLLQQMKMDISSVLFSNKSDPKSSIVVKDKNHTYTNVFDVWSRTEYYTLSETPNILKGLAEKWIKPACRFGEYCSPIEAGSCSNLSEAMKLSYALNLLYQISGQSKCTFDSLGSIEYRDRSPSTAKCLFPVALHRICS